MNKKSIISCSLLIILFGIITFLVLGNYIVEFDNSVYKFIISFKTELLTNFMKIYTQLGGPFVLIVFTIILCIIFRKSKYSYLIPINLVCVYLLNFLTKLFAGRERPLDINLIEESGFSFPSGHSMVSLAFYTYLAYIMSKKLDRKYTPLVWVVTCVLVLFIGISRVYLGVHYASDIIGGFIFAIAYIIIYISLTEKGVK